MMRGGFLPIPAAASVGLLLFVTSTFVVETEVRGNWLQLSSAGTTSALPWAPGKFCRANAIEAEKFPNEHWFGRVSRMPPVPGNGAGALMTLYKKFTSKGHVSDNAQHLPGYCYTGKGNPLIVGAFDNTDISPGGKDLHVPNLVHPLKVAANGKDLEPDLEKLCMYQCVGWNVLQLRTFLENSGQIFVGSAIVVSLADWISQKYGWSLVTADTKALDLVTAIKRSSPANMWMKLFKLVRNSYVMALFPLLLAWIFLEQWLVTKIDSDGFYSVDYYVSFVLLYSLSCVMLLRFWHPFECYPIIYTKGIWTRGVDEFVCYTKEHYADEKGFKRSENIDGFKKVRDVGDKLELLEINLYQWLHLSFHERCELLVHYARRPSKPVYNEEGKEGEPSKVEGEKRTLAGGNEPGEQLQVLADLEVKVFVQREIGGDLCRVQKLISIKEGQVVKIIRWTTEDPCVAVVEVSPCHFTGKKDENDHDVVGEPIQTVTTVDTPAGRTEILVQDAAFFHKGDMIQVSTQQGDGFGPEAQYKIEGVVTKGKINKINLKHLVDGSGLKNLLPSGTSLCIKVQAEIHQLHLIETATDRNHWDDPDKEIEELEAKHRELSSRSLSEVGARGLSSPLLNNAVTPV